MEGKKIIEAQPNFFFREVHMSNLISFKCTHFTFFICWFSLLLAGTTIIGYGASTYTSEQEHCAISQQFCTYDITMDKDRLIYLYLKLEPFYQNNRLYLDAMSLHQLHGKNGSGYECGPFITYKSVGVSQTVGGYRVTEDTKIHPCGYPMKTILDDSVYVVDSEGGTPSLDNELTSNYSTNYHFKRLDNYAVSQWTDVLSSRFVNWMTIGTTSTKYVLMGKVNMTAGDYQVIYKNIYPTQDQFNKTLILAETNNLGMTNHLLGFCLFGYGILMLLIHVAICCKTRE